MTVKEHYDNHLGNFYSWMTGDFEENKINFKNFCLNNSIRPSGSGFAVDLGAGHGIQTVALAELGFMVIAIDFNDQLLDELRKNTGKHKVEIIKGDIRDIRPYSAYIPELIICCGDTLSQLENINEVEQLIEDSYSSLEQKGTIIFTFRDYSNPITDTKRFIPVRSDEKRIFTCFLEYLDEKVMVTDLLYELEYNLWKMKVSSYYKIRLRKNTVTELMLKAGFELLSNKEDKGMTMMIGRKQ